MAIVNWYLYLYTAALRKTKIVYNFTTALRKTEIVYNFGLSECNRVKIKEKNPIEKMLNLFNKGIRAVWVEALVSIGTFSFRSFKRTEEI